MALTAQDFQLTESQIREVNAFIEKAAVDFFASDGDLDPIEIEVLPSRSTSIPPSGGRSPCSPPERRLNWNDASQVASF